MKIKRLKCRLTSPSMCTSLIRPFVSITAVAIFILVITFLEIIYIKRDSLFALQLWRVLCLLCLLFVQDEINYYQKWSPSSYPIAWVSYFYNFLSLHFYFVRCWKGKTHNLISTVLNGIVAFLNLKHKSLYGVQYCITVIVNMLQDYSYYVTCVTVTFIAQYFMDVS